VGFLVGRHLPHLHGLLVISMRSRLFQVLIEPGDDLPQSAQAMVWFPCARQVVVLAMEQDEPAVHPVIAQGSEHLQTLRHVAAVVLI